MSDLDRLTTDEGLVSALNRSAVIYAQRHNLDVSTLSRTVSAILAVDALDAVLPAWATGAAAPDPKEAAPIARAALAAMLNSPPSEGLYAAANDAIAEELAGRPHFVDPLTLSIGGTFVLALALLSKWSWSAKDGHKFASGFPDLDKVLGRIGEIFKKLS